ncbi:zn2cys6 transcription factor [Zalerion maritima]|uniref:Zn2cys6 transcription factor n=1 Tax=Zalerion maritima TaxID=339359 RepID=A0AAD5RK37_9PEZI|nr:zn2cys6 transcription factor [Zalerion maritima]
MIKDENGGRGFDRCRRDEYLDMAEVPDIGAKATSKPHTSGLPALYDSTGMHQQQQQQHPPPPSEQQTPPQHQQTQGGQSQPSQSQQVAQQQQPPQQRTPQPQTRTVKRPRPVKSCTECRKRKLKCDRNLPCSACEKSRRLCKYAADQDAANLSDASDEESERPLKRSCGPPSNHELTLRGADSTPVPAAQQPTIPASMVPMQAFDDLNRRIEVLEKMLTNIARSPSTAGSSSIRHRLAPVNPCLLRDMSIKPTEDSIPGRSKGLRTRFLGATSTRFPDAKDFMMSQNKTEEVKELFMSLRQLHKVFSDNHRAQMVPIQVYVDSMTPIQRRMADILPKRSDCDRLLDMYIKTAETLYRIIHIPTFRLDYEAYWNSERRPESFLPLLLVMMALATKYESRSRGPNGERLDSIHIPTACALVRMWLDGLKGKDLVDMTTLQTEVLLNHTQRMVLKPQESWSRLGFIVRMAMSMGMHRDPSEFGGGIPPFEGEVRRRLWWTILDLDLHMSLQCNLPCAIRNDDFTCRPPLNLDDEDIYPEMNELPDEKPHDQFTSCQQQVHAAKSLPHRLKVVNLINRIDTADEAEILEAGAKLERMLEDVQFNFPRPPVVNDRESARRWRTRVVLDVHCRRPLLALYRPFALGPPSLEPPPLQISRSYIRSSMTLLNFLEEIDPVSTIFHEIQHQYFLLLRQDILQAAFSVCYFIRNEVLRQQQFHHPVAGFADASSPLMRHSSIHSTQPSGLSGSGAWGGAWSAVTPESSAALEDGLGLGVSTRSIIAEDGGYFEQESVCSRRRMEETVARTLETLVSRMREMGSDLKDFVSISVVLNTSRMVTGSQEQKLENTKQGMRKIIETCEQIKNSVTQQPTSFLPPTAMTTPTHNHTPPVQAFGAPPQPGFGFNPHFPTMPHGVDAAWDHEFWSWTVQNAQQNASTPPIPAMQPRHVSNVPMAGAPQI